MNPILNMNLFLVKEQLDMFKVANHYDIYDPETNKLILYCRENHIGFFTKIFRFTRYKNLTPFEIEITTLEGYKLLTVKRGIPLFLSKIEVLDENDHLIGCFKQNIFSFKSEFDVVDAEENTIFTLKGKWSINGGFSLTKNNIEFAKISQEWLGVFQEFFTSADNYLVRINKDVPPDSRLRILILATAICTDMVFYEK